MIKAEQELNYHEKDDQVVSEDWGNLRVLKAVLQTPPDAKMSEQILQKNKPEKEVSF